MCPTQSSNGLEKRPLPNDRTLGSLLYQSLNDFSPLKEVITSSRLQHIVANLCALSRQAWRKPKVKRKDCFELEIWLTFSLNMPTRILPIAPLQNSRRIATRSRVSVVCTPLRDTGSASVRLSSEICTVWTSYMRRKRWGMSSLVRLAVTTTEGIVKLRRAVVR